MATLIEFGTAGWIDVVSPRTAARYLKPGRIPIEIHSPLAEEPRLSDKQIGVVLAVVKAPYSLDQVAEILGRIQSN